MDLGEQIRRRRNELGISREELANLASVTRSQLERIETESGGLYAVRVRNIVTALGCELVLVPAGQDAQRLIDEHGVYQALLHLTHDGLVKLARSIHPEQPVDHRVDYEKTDGALRAVLMGDDAPVSITVHIIFATEGKRTVKTMVLTPEEIITLSRRADVRHIQLATQ